MPLFAELSASHLSLAGLLATSMLMLIHTRRRWQQAAQHRPPDKTPAARQRWDKPHTAFSPAEMRQWEVQIHEFAREVTARIDSKMAALEHLMRSAHHETLRLEAAIAKAHGSEPAADAAASAAVEFTPVSQAQVLKQAVRSAAQGTAAAVAARPHLERPYEQIQALADEGRSSQQIAAEIGTPLGEVELILSLRQQEAR
jgi:hypothetical protein